MVITSEVVALAAIVASAVITIINMWFTTVRGPVYQESSRAKSEKETRIWRQNEERFFTMLTHLESFYKGYLSKEDERKGRIEFVKAYRHIWLYSPDEVIEKVNSFLISIGYQMNVEESHREKATREMIYAMRKTIYGNTKLKPDQFLFVKVS